MKEESKALVIGALLRVEVGNPNAGWTEGTVTTIKKVGLPNGEVHPYISGQALRRYLRDTLTELYKDKVSPEEKTKDPKAPIVTKGRPDKYYDDDLLGFMRAEKNKTYARAASLRVSAAYGVFPLTGDKDLGTRSAKEVKEEAGAGGSIFETEITNNVFRTSMLLELDRVGRWEKYENVNDKNGSVSAKEKKNRIRAYIEALKYLWGGGRRSRFLIDMSPQFFVCARMTKKLPIFLHALDLKYDDGYVLNMELLKEVLSDYKNDIQKLYIGIRKGFLKNEDLLEKELKDVVPTCKAGPVGKIFDEILEEYK
ncbi:MAG: type I-B CRISPR-associated protein Cas7/Cst2/DevR [Candidatus Bilamarchaeaceae archaeon]